ncbi:MAG: carboxypeptidase regulatory-like domain-containing protein [bacterium]|nr:carboxypeptidase regulatory-like domain-containing protein [bacterium]
MKRHIAFAALLLVLSSSAVGWPVVNNSGQSAEDSVSFAFRSLDSLGNPVAADSFFVLVVGPSGDSVFAEAITTGSSRLDSVMQADAPIYIYGVAVADIDGSGSAGSYSVSISARSSNLSLTTPFVGSFQLVDWELDDMGDSIGLAAEYAAAALDSLGRCLEALDSLSPGTATVDSASVARAVWNAPQINHVLGGTFGRYLDTEISGMGSGSGAFAVTLVATDSSSSQPVAGARIAVRNLDQSGLIAVGSSDASGRTLLNLDADSFVVVASAPGYIFEAYDTVEIAGAATDTIWCFRFDPGEPASPSLCRVYGRLFTLEGVPTSEATVTAHLPKGVSRMGDVIVSPFPVTATTDSTGYFYLDLIPSDSLVGNDTRYELAISRSDGNILRKRMKIPTATSWQLSW